MDNRFFYRILASAILLETVFLFYTKNIFGQTVNAILYATNSLSIGILLLQGFYNKNVRIDEPTKAQKNNTYLLLLFVLPAIVLVILQSQLFARFQVDPKHSDIIPSIQLMVKRFVTGEYVYNPSHDFGYLLYPTYLPMQWLPFTIAELCQFDYRWIATAIFLFALTILCVRLSIINTAYSARFLIPIMLYFLYFTLFDRERGMVAHTVELMVTGYYMLFIMALSQRSVWLLAISIAVCLLSRFSLVLWLPLAIFVLLLSGRKVDVFKITTTVITIILLVYVIPFLSKDWSAFTNGMKHYTGAAIGEWEHFDDKGKPYQLYNGTGLAHLFYENMDGTTVADNVAKAKKTHLILSLTTTCVLGIWYWFNRKKIDYRIFLMASFKIYFTVFLAFIQVPYIYLMTVANFISIAIFAEQLRYRVMTVNKKATA